MKDKSNPLPASGAQKVRGKARAAAKPAAEEDRSSAILEAAFQVFARSGYAAARMEEIAELAGVTKGLIYFYFENKEALFKAVIRHHLFENVYSGLNLLEINPSRSMTSHLMQALAIMSGMMDARNNPLVPGVLRLLLTEGERFQELHRFHYQEVIRPLMARIQQILDEGARRGEWSADRVPAFMQIVVSPIIVRLLWNMIFGSSEHLDENVFLRQHQLSLLHMLGVDPAALEQEAPLPAPIVPTALPTSLPAPTRPAAAEAQDIPPRHGLRRPSLLRRKRKL